MIIHCHLVDLILGFPVEPLGILKDTWEITIHIVGCQCHILDMVLHGIMHIEADSPAMVLHDVSY
ncbi:hypothetical protein F383_31395 [Gossypium arboreum]|uniref:Uncharacterized protein n=1 Tax=Gossypium arboreum TaxID=29729 RepID=A0A0B0PEU4_GOSAR|nr:hypothetical protein F383_31395 [Gossypium arboreum]